MQAAKPPKLIQTLSNGASFIIQRPGDADLRCDRGGETW